jgi:DNA adenine methylase
MGNSCLDNHTQVLPIRDKNYLKVSSRIPRRALPPGTPEAVVSIPPLIKWPGGKRWLANELAEAFPRKAKRYYEPFLGGAAVFFAFRPEKAILSDTNPELVNCYVQVRDNPDQLLRALRRLHNTEANYYRVRSQEPTNLINRAARLLFLTTLSFNGIFRQNLEGVFNVPYGKKIHLNPADGQRIVAASGGLQGAKIICSDFEEATDTARKDDLVYFDPPYTVAHGNNGFLKYNAKIFSWDDQVRLAKTAQRLSERGCFVFVSNADHASIRSLYRGFKTKVLQRHSKIAASSSFRKAITECLFFNAEVIRGATAKRS